MYDKSSLQALNYHLSMLKDSVRTSSLQRAIEATVKPGDVVLDLGCGTGILGYFACRAGARRVYAMEGGEIIDLARRICNANGFTDRIVFIDSLSTEAELPELVDVIVTETIGNFGVDEGILSSIIDAKKRFLKAGGTIIPRVLELFVAPFEHGRFYKQIEDWDAGLLGLDFSVARHVAANSLHWVKVDFENLLGRAASLLSFDLPAMEMTEVAGAAALEIQREGTLHGLAGWFKADLAPGIQLTNAPPLEAHSWTHAVFPLERPISVQTGDQLKVQFKCPLNSTVMNWQIELQRGKGGVSPEILLNSTQSSFFGKLFSKAVLKAGHSQRET